MKEKDLYEMVEILIGMPEEEYLKCKSDLLNDDMYKSHKSTEFLKKLFDLVEKNRTELHSCC